MKILITLLVIYFLVISIVSAIVTIYDKHCAVSHKFRVSEKMLFLLALCGGSAVMLLTMIAIHHKTRHLKFMLGLPAIIIVQCGFLLILWRLAYA